MSNALIEKSVEYLNKTSLLESKTKSSFKPEMSGSELYDISQKTDNPKDHKAIANHPNSHDYTLANVAHRTKDPEIHRDIIKHPNSGEFSMLHIARNTTNPEIHRAIINHPRAPRGAWDWALDEIIKKTTDPKIKKDAEEKIRESNKFRPGDHII